MIEDWRVTKLGEVSDFQGGSQPPKSQFINSPKKGYVRLLQIRDFKRDDKDVYVLQSPKNKLCEADDIMIGRYGASVGQILRGKTGAYNVALIRTIPDDRMINRTFFYYYLTSNLFQKPLLSVAGSRSAQAGFSKPDIAEFPFLLPPIPEQKRIVAILDEAFAGISLAVANAEKNLANARELFESYLNNVFTQKGEGWVETTLGQSCEFFNGKAHEKAIDENGQYIVVNSKFISQEGKIVKKTNALMHPLFVDDIAMVMSDVPKGKALAKCFLVDEDNKYSLNQRICQIRTKEFVPQFLLFQLNRNPHLLAFDNKGSQANLRKGDILSCPLYKPSLEDQRTIASDILTTQLHTRNLEVIYQQKLNALAELKQSILQKAFAGEL